MTKSFASLAEYAAFLQALKTAFPSIQGLPDPAFVDYNSGYATGITIAFTGVILTGKQATVNATIP